MYEAWNYLDNHKIFDGHFVSCLDIFVVKVNPKTDEIDDDENLNTKTEIWLECGAYNKNYMCHDVDLDCGGNTFEEAIIKLAKLVKEKFD